MIHSNPTGSCLCGCGGTAPLAPFTDSKKGYVKGQPLRFIRGHHNRNIQFSDKTKIGRMRTAALEIYKQHKIEGTLPTSARFLYYELVANGTIIKGKDGNENDYNLMISALTWLRENGQVDWDDIVDETRSLTQWEVYPTIAIGIRSAWRNARLNLWLPGVPPMVICESRSLAGVLENLASEYQLPIASTNGQTGGFLHTSVGPALIEDQSVFYFGDLDFSGGHIESNTREVLERIAGNLKWERLAITQEQAGAEQLTPIRRYDGRTKSHHDAIETEALGQSHIVRLLLNRITDLMPESRKMPIHKRGERERRKLGKSLGYSNKEQRVQR